MAKNAAATRQRLLDAATVEFAEHGIAGSRVDRISERAGCNKSLIYSYFGNKSQLFDAVYESMMLETAEDLHLDPQHLSEYAGAFFDYVLDHPRVLRLALWSVLERGAAGETPESRKAVAQKIDSIRDAQAAGAVDPALPAAHLLAIVTAMAASPLIVAAEALPVEPAALRASVVAAVRQLTASNPGARNSDGGA